VSEGTLTAHPMFSYTYLDFDGGHDGLWEFGGQIRKPMASGGARPFWLGGEAAVSHLTTSVDALGTSFSSSTNGFSLTALAGRAIGQSRWGFNLYGGAGLSHYGSTGFNIRAGIDLQPWFLTQD
jgi:hypothetical protein